MRFIEPDTFRNRGVISLVDGRLGGKLDYDSLGDMFDFSGGVNLFNVSQTTAVFAKVDYTFGEDVQGVGGKAGARAAW